MCRCKKVKILVVISIYGLRYIYVFILLYVGVLIVLVVKRLGYLSMNIIEWIYLYIINEFENKDIDLVMRLIFVFN